jgi:hypothetical protein
VVLEIKNLADEKKYKFPIFSFIQITPNYLKDNYFKDIFKEYKEPKFEFKVEDSDGFKVINM